jgi:hypothetical protein
VDGIRAVEGARVSTRRTTPQTATPRPAGARRATGRDGGPRTPARPRPPAALDRATVDDHSIEDEVVFRRIGFMDIDLSRQHGRSVEFEQCRFTRATLAGVTLERADFGDCRIETSDWANLRTTVSSMIRVECTGVRLTGLAWTDGPCGTSPSGNAGWTCPGSGSRR